MSVPKNDLNDQTPRQQTGAAEGLLTVTYKGGLRQELSGGIVGLDKPSTVEASNLVSQSISENAAPLPFAPKVRSKHYRDVSEPVAGGTQCRAVI